MTVTGFGLSICGGHAFLAVFMASAYQAFQAYWKGPALQTFFVQESFQRQ
jgi:hypothetical protein